MKRLIDRIAKKQAPRSGGSPEAQGQRRGTPLRSRRTLHALESRIVFDGAAVTAAAAIPEAHPDPVPATPAPATHEVVFVDSHVQDASTLLQGVSPQAEVVYLNAGSDGVKQMADYLAGRHDISAIYIVSHGDQGLLLLGNGPLFSGNLDAHSADLATIGSALTPGGDILLYGCNVAQGDAGRAFVNALAAATGADVAASSNDTGAASLGGDWNLEIATGTIEAAPILGAASSGSYDHLLTTTSVSTALQLQAAINAGSTDGVDDIITLTGNITLPGGQININVTDGHTMTIVGGGYTLDANYQSRAIYIQGGTVRINNLTITHGLLSGAGGNSGRNGSAGGDALGAAIYNAGTLTITGCIITGNVATGGGGGGGGDNGAAWGGYAGGGGSGFNGVGGAPGGSATGYYSHTTNTLIGAAGGGGSGGGGAGGGIGSCAPVGSIGGLTWDGGARVGGNGGTSAGGGAGGTPTGLYLGPWRTGGYGGTAGGSGGGGGGSGYNGVGNGGDGGSAVGGIYNAGILNIASTTFSNNLGSGGGGGGAGQDGGTDGLGGFGAGAIWNAVGGTLQYQSSTTTFTGNVGGNGGDGGRTDTSNPGLAGPNNIYGTTFSSTWALPPTFSGLALSADTGSSSTDFITATAAQTITATLSAALVAGDTVWGSLDNGVHWTDITSKVSGTTLTWDGATLAGANTLKLKVTDSFGNTGTVASHTYTLDTSAPSAPGALDMSAGTDTGTSNSDNITNDTTPTFTGTSEAGSTVTLYDGATLIGTSTADGSGNWSITSSALSAGTHTLTAKAMDAAGNTSAASTGLDVTIDTTAPAAPTVSLVRDTGSSSTDGVTSNGMVNVAGREAGATWQYSLDGGTTWTAGTGNSVTLAGDGNKSIQVRQIDVAGNVSATAPLVFTLDTTAPSAPTVSLVRDTGSSSTDGITNYSTVNLTGLEAGATWQFSQDGGVTWFNNPPWYDTQSGSFSFGFVSHDGAASIQARQIDAAGNVSAISAPLNFIVDTSAAAPTGLDLAAASDSGASNTDNVTNVTTPTITGSGAEAGAIVTLYDTNRTAVLGTTTADGSGNWSITSSALGEGGHTLTVKQTDVAGNTSAASAGLRVTVDTFAAAPMGLDLAAASDSGASNTDNLTNVTTPTITGTAEAGATVTLYDTDGTTVLGTATADGSGNWSITSSVLGEGGHTLAAKQTDVAGNTSGASAGLTVTVDTLAPSAPSGLDLAAASDSGVSDTDHLTNVTTPTITGSAEAGATVTLYDTNGTTVLGTAIADGSGNWSITSSALGDGTHTLTVRQTDVAGNTSAASAGLSITVDTSAAAPTGLDLAAASDSGASSTDNVTDVTTPTITGSGAEAGAAVTLYDTDGATVLGTATADGSGNWSITSSALGDGAHTLTATQTDIAGNTSAASAGLSITVDTSAAAPTGLDLAAASDSGVSDTDNVTSVVTPTITGTAEAGASVTLYDTNGTTVLGITTADGAGYWSITSSALSEGSHTLTARQTDIAGNTSAASAGLVVTVDTSTAVPTGLDLAAASDSGASNTDNITNVTTPTITGSGAEAGASMTLYDTNGTTVLGTAIADGSGNWSITSSALGDGTHTLTVRQTDVAGNTSAASAGLSITVDTSAAAPTGLDLAAASDSGSSNTDNLTNFSTPTVSGSGAEAGATVTLYDTDGATVLGTAIADGSGHWSITSSALGDGAHTLTATQTDIAGNTSVASAGLSVTIDTTAPAAPTGLDLAAASDSGTSNTDNLTNVATPTVSGSGAEAGATVTLYDTNGTTVLGTAVADGAGNWSITSSALGEGSHTLAAKQTDLAGNVSAASAGLVLTVDRTAPGITFSGLAFSADTGAPGDFRTTTAAQTITATLSAGLGAGDRVWGSLDNGATWTELTSKVSGTTLTWDGVTLAGSNTLKLKVIDAAGNDGTVTSQAYVLETVPPPPPVQAPPVQVPPVTVLPVVTLPPPAIPPVTQALQDLPSSASAPSILIDVGSMSSSLPGSDRGLDTVSIEPGQPFTFSLPRDAAGAGQAQVTYQVALADGGPLPGWLRFDAQTGTFSGVMPPGEKGPLQIRVKAVDSQGRAVVTTVTVKGEAAPREKAERPPAPRAAVPLSGEGLLAVLGLGSGLHREAVFPPETWPDPAAAEAGDGPARPLSAQLRGEASRFGQARAATLRHLAALAEAA